MFTEYELALMVRQIESALSGTTQESKDAARTLLEMVAHIGECHARLRTLQRVEKCMEKFSGKFQFACDLEAELLESVADRADDIAYTSPEVSSHS